MNKVICVYSSSSSSIDAVYTEVAQELGREIATKGDSLLFGGGLNGLMGITAKAVHQHGGKVIGVIPEALNQKGIVYENCDELIVTKDMRDRKGIMDLRSDAFIALPGGYGTLEEILEIITLKQLGYHRKPIVILNTNDFYENLIKQFEVILKGNFAKEICSKLYFITDNIKVALDYIDSYIPFTSKEKWLTDVDTSLNKEKVKQTV